jgi:hypothetical protein
MAEHVTSRQFQHDRLLHALIGDDMEKRRSYNDIPEFYHAMNLLSRTLPRFVEMMHDEAKFAEASRKHLMQQALLAPPTRLLLDELPDPD